MPNGKPGDHPLNDMFSHGAHPFPADIEDMIWRLARTDRVCTYYGCEQLERLTQQLS